MEEKSSKFNIKFDDPTETDAAETETLQPEGDDPPPPDDPPSSRQKWGRQIEFILSSLSYAVGLGNIWRFPYLCYKNGGGAFLIPYAIMLVTCGMPLMFFELCLGQFGREGPITVWKICPLFQGIGYAMFMISFFIGCYYNIILAWTIYYIYSSFTSILPWTTCNNGWNTDKCKNLDIQDCSLNGGLMMLNGTCYFMNSTTAEEWKMINQSVMTHRSPADEYFHDHVLDISDGFHDFGGFQIQVVLALAVAWLIVYLVLIKGVDSFGKVVYFTATFPYLILIVLLVKAATLPGYVEGITFYLTPQWEKIFTVNVWVDAAVQIFFSLSPCWGGLITLASYNKFHNNCYRDALIVSFGNCLTSFFAGFVIFGVIGFMAHELGQEVGDVVKQGPGLAFVAYPEAVAKLPVAPAWSILFFAMLLTLGLGTQFTILTTIITTITDDFPSLRGRNYKFGLLGVCVVMFLVGLPMTTNAGMYVLQMMDSYSSTFSALMVGATEVIVVTWIYGVDNFLEDIKLMLGKYPYPRAFWKVVWKFGMPLMVTTILFCSFVFYKPPSYGNYDFPPYANAVGWLLAFSSVSAIPIVAIVKIMSESGTLTERIQKLIKPKSEWCAPADEFIRPNDSFAAKPLLKVTSFASTGLENKI